MERPGLRVRDAVRPYAEDAGQQLGGQDGVRGPGGDDPAAVDDMDQVAVQGGQIQVVQGGEHGQAAVADQGEDFQLVGDVEVVGGLVEHEDPGLLGEGAGDQDALPLAAGEAEEAAFGQVSRADPRQRLVAEAAVLVGCPGHRSLVRQTSHGHDLGDGEVEFGDRVLRKCGQSPGAFPCAEGVEVLTADPDGAGRGRRAR